MRKQGAEFEYQARLFLQKQGLHFIAANQSFPCGEIDLIMREQEVLVFIEVRQRKNSNYGTAAESVDWRKQQKLVKTANLWLAQQDMSLDNIDCRFDLITFNHKSNQINWFPNFIELNN